MLARKYTLKSHADFQRVKKEGKPVSSESFTLLVHYRHDKEPSRFGFVISAKVAKEASLRNRAKRALSEGVRVSSYNLKSGYDCLFLAKSIIVKKYTQDLMQEVAYALKKAHLYL
jgi:ribonuclease P protein component